MTDLDKLPIRSEILMVLGRAGEPVLRAKLQEMIGIGTPVWQYVDKLVHDQYVVRSKSGRKNFLALSQKGQEWVDNRLDRSRSFVSRPPAGPRLGGAAGDRP